MLHPDAVVIFDISPMVHKETSKQWLNELDSWSRLLDYYKEEIVRIKNELAQMIDGVIHPEVLKEVEQFQTILINKDIVIDFIRNEIIREKMKIQEDTAHQNYTVLQTAIQKDMSKLEAMFNKTKSDFYLWKASQKTVN